MRYITPIFIAIVILLSACTTAPIEALLDRTTFIAKTTDESFETLQPPNDFTVKPVEAYKIATNNRIQKVSWSIYADYKNYYLVKNAPLFFTTSAHARMYGIRVNGKTGKSDKCMEQ